MKIMLSNTKKNRIPAATTFTLAATVAAIAFTFDPSAANAAKDLASYTTGWGENMKALANVIGWGATLFGLGIIVMSGVSFYSKSKGLGQQGAQTQGLAGVAVGAIAGVVLIGIPVLLDVGPATIWGDDAKTVKIGDTNFATSIGK